MENPGSPLPEMQLGQNFTPAPPPLPVQSPEKMVLAKMLQQFMEQNQQQGPGAPNASGQATPSALPQIPIQGGGSLGEGGMSAAAPRGINPLATLGGAVGQIARAVGTYKQVQFQKKMQESKGFTEQYLNKVMLAEQQTDPQAKAQLMKEAQAMLQDPKTAKVLAKAGDPTSAEYAGIQVAYKQAQAEQTRKLQMQEQQAKIAAEGERRKAEFMRAWAEAQRGLGLAEKPAVDIEKERVKGEVKLADTDKKTTSAEAIAGTKAASAEKITDKKTASAERIAKEKDANAKQLRAMQDNTRLLIAGMQDSTKRTIAANGGKMPAAAVNRASLADTLLKKNEKTGLSILDSAEQSIKSAQASGKLDLLPRNVAAMEVALRTGTIDPQLARIYSDLKSAQLIYSGIHGIRGKYASEDLEKAYGALRLNPDALLLNLKGERQLAEVVRDIGYGNKPTADQPAGAAPVIQEKKADYFVPRKQQ